MYDTVSTFAAPRVHHSRTMKFPGMHVGRDFVVPERETHRAAKVDTVSTVEMRQEPGTGRGLLG
ncbi:hypothetical protein SAMN05661093_07317 [Kibdelosporangium aridum]|uniref:Uncharacterized protein n=1 Tax=Kibdelosporangium aridum TaxID=2030 RepID=A0A1Y5XZK0_KIBAR|nr:hypothetical protein SAMN05661093_07317 [Kibdelosporangium aridum]